ncbi:MAG: primosomal protein N' [Clostridia bacterium]|nr:primosomal protein N' [Clostridia bacterium]
MEYVAVRILDIPYHVDKPYAYYLPPQTNDGDGLGGTVGIGSFVMVPFGGGANRRVMGIVTKCMTEETLPHDLDPKRCKPVSKLVSAEFVLSDELMSLCQFIAENTFCTFGDAAKTVIPAGALKRMYEQYEVSHDADAERLYLEKYAPYECMERTVYEGIRRAKSVRREKLEGKFGTGSTAAAESMVKKGILVRRTRLSGSENSASSEFIRSLLPQEDLLGLIENNSLIREKYHYRRRSEVCISLMKRLYEQEGDEISRTELTGEYNIPWKAVTELEKSGILAVRHQTEYRNPYAAAAQLAPKDDNILSPAQEEARRQLSSLYETHTAKAALLYGVTGSGKTRVIKAMMDEVIADGRQVIMLVPEISLTPQSVSVFCSYYGDRVAVLHSGLSAGERLDVWRRAKRGDVDLVIGTRSAVFAPFDRLGMIVIDEEQEHTYKSDITPKYHARDAARFRCAKNDALLLLASATPSFESFYKAEKGIYTLVRLTERYGGAKLPEVVMADMHEVSVDNSNSETPLGPVLSDAIRETKEKNEQAILFINRRGYNKYIACLSCREPIMCPHCSVPMTLHQRYRGGAAETFEDGTITGVLICHYCGERVTPPMTCPACGAPHLHAFGYGTERAERDVETRFPDICTVRMDMDTTQGKFAHEEILEKFRNREADILLGTQMVTKGHDFPRVTLVGVLAADALLYQDDYRAAEKAFSLITQVIGRAGRGALAGRAIIQTYNPQNEVLQLAAKQDFETFYRGAIRMREAMVFPPFCDMVLISFSSAEETEVMAAAGKFSRRLSALTAPDGEFSDVPIVVFGPFEAQIYKLNERYRMRMILKCRTNRRTRTLLESLMREFSAVCGNRVSIGIDVNPSNL